MRYSSIFSVFLLCLTGCTTHSETPQISADQMVDEQIAQSANTLTIAQVRLHETSARQQSASPPFVSPISAPTDHFTGSGALITTPHNPSNVKDFKPTANAQPAKVVIVEIPPAPPKPPIAVKLASIATPPVIQPVAKPIEAPWVVSPTDVTVRRVLVKWVARAGWQLVWDASVDVPVTVTASINGDFKSAVKRLFLSLSAADVNLSVLMYSGNKVLRVTESGRRAQ